MNIKEQRLNRLNEIVRKYAKEKTTRWVGKSVKVLVEGKSKTNKSVLFGYSPDWKIVNFTGKAKIGSIVNVYIESASRFSLNGKIKK
jgi:tRNA-2-methylthio-N6-dimethylallyladenosine synthase